MFDILQGQAVPFLLRGKGATPVKVGVTAFVNWYRSYYAL